MTKGKKRIEMGFDHSANLTQFPITGIREIAILRSLNHPNIVQLQAVISSSTCITFFIDFLAPENLDMYMVFEYMDHDLTGIINNSAATYTIAHIKCLSAQLFKGLAYLHDQKIIHRDVKGTRTFNN